MTAHPRARIPLLRSTRSWLVPLALVVGALAGCAGAEDAPEGEVVEDPVPGAAAPGPCQDQADAVGGVLGIPFLSTAPLAAPAHGGGSQDLGYLCSFESAGSQAQVSTVTVHFTDEDALAAAVAAPEGATPHDADTQGGEGFTLIEDDTATAVLARGSWVRSFTLQVQAGDDVEVEVPATAAVEAAVSAMADAVDPDALDLEPLAQPTSTSTTGDA